MRGHRLSAIALTAVLSAQAQADDQHYQDFIVGDEAVGLGGAYTAIAADPSGGWYNPAGIVDVRNTSLSLSANLYGIQDSSTGRSGFIDPADAISKLSVVPSSAGFVQALGLADRDGRRPIALGMSLVVPSYRTFSTSKQGRFVDPNLGQVRSGYDRSYTDSTLWAGLLGALRINWKLSVGLALFLKHRSVQDAAHSYVATDLQADEYRTFRAAMTELDFSNYALVAALGIKLELSPRFFLGAMVRSPSLTIYSRGNMRFARSRADGSNPATFLPTPERVSVESESRINGEGRFGLAYVIPQLLKVAADVSFHLPVSFTLVDVEDPVAAEALLIAPKIERSLVVNGNLGVEVTIAKVVSIGVGGFSNFSSAPSIPAEASRPAPAHVNMFGGTLALGYASTHTLTRLGFLYAYGSGEDVHAVNDPSQLDSDRQGFVRVSLNQTYFYFFLSSTFRY